MKDIICRAKVDWDFPWYDNESAATKEADEWVYGYFTLYSQCLPAGKAVIETVDNDYKVREDTVCLNTGLTDIGGNLLYEGDIVTNHEDFTAVICYSDFCFNAICENNNVLFLTDLDNFEIIGNIYDNPEWLGIFDLED